MTWLVCRCRALLVWSAVEFVSGVARCVYLFIGTAVVIWLWRRLVVSVRIVLVLRDLDLKLLGVLVRIGVIARVLYL